MKFTIALTLVLLLSSSSNIESQTKNMTGQSKIVKNRGSGSWKTGEEASLQLIIVLGDMESESEDYLFYLPEDITSDRDKNIYVLDSGNFRVQEFDKEGQFMQIFGRKGNGPGEMSMPISVDIDVNGLLYVMDQSNRMLHIYNSDGTTNKSTSMENMSGVTRVKSDGVLHVTGIGKKLFELASGEIEINEMSTMSIIDYYGNVLSEYGRLEDFGSLSANLTVNTIFAAFDSEGNTLVSYQSLNKIKKYDSNGKLILPLNYDIVVPEPEVHNLSQQGKQMMFMVETEEKSTLVSQGIAIDGQNRTWILTAQRQFRENEEVKIVSSISIAAGGSIQTGNSKLMGDTELRECDMWGLEVYDNNGILQGIVPITHYADKIRKFDDRLFLTNKLRDIQVFQYRIVK